MFKLSNLGERTKSDSPKKFRFKAAFFKAVAVVAVAVLVYGTPFLRNFVEVDSVSAHACELLINKKIVPPAATQPGQQMTFTIWAKNAGIETCTNVKITDAIDPLLTVDLITWDHNGTLDGNPQLSSSNVITATAAKWEPQQWATFSVDVTVGTPTLCEKVINNTAQINATEDITGTNSNTETATITVPNCTGNLLVKKYVINDSGGSKTAADFNIHVRNSSGVEVSGSPSAGSATGKSYTLPAGSYVISEDSVSGYTNEGVAGDCTVDGKITLNRGESKVCTVVNNDTAPPKATLKVIKRVVNTHGGTKQPGDFNLNVTGLNVSPSSFAGSESGTTVTLSPGAFSVDESVVAGYVKSTSGDCSGVIEAGQTKTCTVVNNDTAPSNATLIVKKRVVNDNSGTQQASNFTLNVSGSNVSQGSVTGSESGTAVTLSPGSYAVTEPAVTGYTATFESACTGTIAAGETRTCTVTNNDVASTTATLIVKKKVINDNGGTLQANSFMLNISGNSPSQTSVPGNENGVAITLNPGAYSVSESGSAQYTSTFDAVCAGTIAAGETKTCTVTNNDIVQGCPANTPDVNTINVSIAGGGQVTGPNITLNFTYGSNVTGIAISNYADFHQQTFINPTPSRNWVLLSGAGQKTVYVRFYTSDNQCFNTKTVVANVTSGPAGGPPPTTLPRTGVMEDVLAVLSLGGLYVARELKNLLAKKRGLA